MSNTGLVTTTIWHEQTYLVKINVLDNYLAISITDQQSGEEWQCNYDHLYVENLTHKTGNFKPFDTFVAMLKAGLLKTRSCVHLDLLTYEDLESLRIRRFHTQTSIQNGRSKNSNRRYLILKYNADFDRINYPLPLEYCGPPDPHFLQATIKRLESELFKTRNEMDNKDDYNSLMNLEQRTKRLENENYDLKLQLRFQKHKSPSSKTLQNALSQLECIVQSERKSHLKLVEHMRFEKVKLLKTIDKLKQSEICLKSQLNQLHGMKRLDSGDTSFGSRRTLKTLYRRSRSLSQDSLRNTMNKLHPSPDSSIVLHPKGMQKVKPIQKQSRRDMSVRSTSSACSSTNSSTNRTVKHVPRKCSRSSSKDSTKHSSLSSQNSTRGSPYTTSDMKQRKPPRSKIRNPKLPSKPVKYDFTDLEKKVSSLQKLLNTKRR